MQIGSFQRTRHGYEGHVATLGLDVRLCLVPADPGDGEHLPDWRIHRGNAESGAEVGAGWNRTGDKAGSYIAVVIDCPTLPRPVRANLFRPGQENGLHPLLWSRDHRRDARS